MYEAYAHGKPDFVNFFKDYNSSVDFPSSLFAKELAEVFPDAKVILTVRDPNKWYDSFSETILDISSSWQMRYVLSNCIPMFYYLDKLHSVMFKSAFPSLALTDREITTREFTEYNERMIRDIPSSRLLVFEVKQGWEPLCTFLGVPVPSVPFPNKNDTQEFKKTASLSKFLGGGIVTFLFLFSVF